MKLPARRNLSHLVADDLLAQIRAGAIAPGDRLATERGLMERYGVGRGAVREALQSLVAMGVLDVRPGRGAVVVGIGTQEALDPETISALLERPAIEDLYDFRELLEVEAAGRAATKAPPAARSEIAEALGRLRAARQTGMVSYLADLDFHRAVVVASENVIFVRVLDAVADLLSSVRRQTEEVPGAVELAMGEHEAIFRAIEARDPDGARLATMQHIASGRAAVAEAQLMARQRRSQPATNNRASATIRAASVTAAPVGELASVESVAANAAGKVLAGASTVGGTS